ncbi:MAG: alkaline phosphatase family protein, partial [Candidatus Aenigmarchaeota archaeon]|nr:alkaline phosphatase family protein [Candidatus Aenigmarchaeota archaeon]
PSPKVSTYDQRPQMSAKFVKKKTIDAMNNDKYDFILTNFANADMVGHTGNMDAAIEACTFVDNCLGEIVEQSKNSGYSMIVTADHGNSDCMIHPDGTPHTAHTFNPVPFVIVDDQYSHLKLKQSGNLYNIAPTILKLSGLKSDHMSQHLIR